MNSHEGDIYDRLLKLGSGSSQTANLDPAKRLERIIETMTPTERAHEMRAAAGIIADVRQLASSLIGSRENETGPLARALLDLLVSGIERAGIEIGRQADGVEKGVDHG